MNARTANETHANAHDEDVMVDPVRCVAYISDIETSRQYLGIHMEVKRLEIN